MILGGVLLATIAWAVTFGLPWGNFWIKIGCSVAAVCLYSLIWHRPRLRIRPASVLLGAAGAAVLYGIFVVGHALGPYLIPHSTAQVHGIYALGKGGSRVLIFLLLCFITGPGEEIFWRGFVQDSLADRWGAFPAYLFTTGIYGAVHLFSLNLMLVLAAWVAGAFWGAFYLWRRDLVPVIISHSLWSAFIFAVVPVT